MPLRKTLATLMLAAGLMFVPGAAMADTIQGDNHSHDDTARSGAAVAANTANTHAGPHGGGSKSQHGNNNVRVNQRSNARSGDAFAGSQVIRR